MVMRIDMEYERVTQFCQAWHIRRLAVFGSALRDDFGPTSDLDLLVEFEPDHTPGLFDIARMERELPAEQKGARWTSAHRSRHFRERVLHEAEVLYGHG